MAKLYFRYGTVGSAKTLNLLAVAHNYERQGKRVLVIKPAFDSRYGTAEVVDIREDDGQRLADFTVTTVNQDGTPVVTGTATARIG